MMTSVTTDAAAEVQLRFTSDTGTQDTSVHRNMKGESVG